MFTFPSKLIMEFHQVEADTVQLFKEASISFLAIWYFKFLLKCAICTQNLWFFDKCKKNKVFPKYMKLKTDNYSQSAKKGSQAGLKKWIQEEMKSQYRKRGIYNVYQKVVHTELVNRLHYAEFTNLDLDTRDKVETIIHKKYLTQKQKLKNLINVSSNFKKKKKEREQSKLTDHKFFDKFINLSNTNFSKQEINFLEKGFKFNNSNSEFSSRNYEILGVETELALNSISPNLTNLKYEASNIIKKEFLIKKATPKIHSNIIRQIKQKSVDENVIFTKADKGNTVVAMASNEYVQKTLEFLNPARYIILSKDPTEIFQKTVKTIINNCKSLFNDRDSSILTLMNPQSPKLYSLIKLHKTGYPIRPVVSFFSAPSYKLSKKLIDIINHSTNFIAKFQIKNSLDLIRKIENLKIPSNSKLISFDVCNLFPSIPINDTIALVEELLSVKNVNIVKKQDILASLKTCLEQNYFEFNGTIYSSKEGLIMGNPLSPLLAEIFMDSLENKISKHPLFSKFVYWYRYVDDILACFTGTDRQLQLFLDYINNIHPNIKFTIEIENNNSINFLDLTISRKENKHVFSIFHKPTHTDTTIHKSSCHPTQHKHAAFYSMIHRLITVPMINTNFQKELNIIKQIAINNGYTTQLINKILNKKLYKKALNMIFPFTRDNGNNFKIITYIGQASEIIAKFLKKLNINIAFKTNNSTGSLIKNNKSKLNNNNKSGIYQLTCNDCPKTYIGQSGRSFSKRIKEHYTCYIKEKTHSNYANHLIECNHNFNTNFKILHTENKGRKLDLLESLEINKLKDTNHLLNCQTDLNKSPLLNLF